MLPHSRVFFTCGDVEQTYRKLTARGVGFAAPPQQMHFAWSSMFTYLSGTSGVCSARGATSRARNPPHPRAAAGRRSGATPERGSR